MMFHMMCCAIIATQTSLVPDNISAIAQRLITISSSRELDAIDAKTPNTVWLFHSLPSGYHAFATSGQKRPQYAILEKDDRRVAVATRIAFYAGEGPTLDHPKEDVTNVESQLRPLLTGFKRTVLGSTVLYQRPGRVSVMISTTGSSPGYQIYLWAFRPGVRILAPTNPCDDPRAPINECGVEWKQVGAWAGSSRSRAPTMSISRIGLTPRY